ncbi:MAG: hypothetical protein OXC12_00850, partial [Spirochaetaceae bacterium]|nr:hypothetical protein [Spirochaetaceae bacterium]
ARLRDRAAGYVEQGWAQCCDAVDANGSGVPPFSKRADCWCALGAIRASLVRIGLITLYQDAAGDLQYPKAMTPFAVSVYSRALCAAAQAMVGRVPKHPALYASVVTKWNDTEAMSGEGVARKLREAATLIWRRIEHVQAGIAGSAS